LRGGPVVASGAAGGRAAPFMVKLPLTIAQLSAGTAAHFHPTAPSERSLPAGARLDGLRVLVVDDDPDALELATAILAGAGARVKTCGAASEALDVLPQWRPHVLVSDIEMPGEDGYSLIKKVRALPAERGGQIPA